MPFDVCSGWKGKTWKLIRFVDLDYHPNVSELISTAAEQEMQEGKKGICLEENTFLSVLNWKWEHFAERAAFQYRVVIIWPIRDKSYYSKATFFKTKPQNTQKKKFKVKDERQFIFSDFRISMSTRGPFIYYVITFLGFLDPPPPLQVIT